MGRHILFSVIFLCFQTTSFNSLENPDIKKTLSRRESRSFYFPIVLKNVLMAFFSKGKRSIVLNLKYIPKDFLLKHTTE